MYTKNGKKLIGEALVGLLSILLLLLVIVIIGSRVNGFGVRRSMVQVIATNVAIVAGTNEIRQSQAKRRNEHPAVDRRVKRAGVPGRS